MLLVNGSTCDNGLHNRRVSAQLGFTSLSTAIHIGALQKAMSQITVSEIIDATFRSRHIDSDQSDSLRIICLPHQVSPFRLYDS